MKLQEHNVKNHNILEYNSVTLYTLVYKTWLSINLFFLAVSSGSFVFSLLTFLLLLMYSVAYRGGSPLPEIPKALQNRAKINPIVKTVKNCWI